CVLSWQLEAKFMLITICQRTQNEMMNCFLLRALSCLAPKTLAKFLAALLGSAAITVAAPSHATAQTADAGTIETSCFRFTLQATNGDCEILDKLAGITWRAETNDSGFGWVTLNSEKRYRLTRCAVHTTGSELTAAFYPYNVKPSSRVLLQARALPD